jgi:hypothetical protein
MADSTRKVTLTFGGDAFADGRVPLTLLAEKLKALQSLLFHAAATVTQDSVGRRGQWANRYRDAVELRFSDAHHSELTIEAELPDAGLFEDYENLGTQALDLAYGFAEDVDAGRADAVAQRVPDRQERLLLLRTLEQLAPRSPETYALTFANGSASHAGVRITALTRARTQILIYRQLLDEASGVEEARVVGTLTKIHYDVAPQMLSVRVSTGHEVKCYYDESLREQVASLCAGSIVEVVGLAGTSSGGRLKQIDYVKTVDPVSMEPIRISKFEHGGQVYRLREALPFNVEFIENVWAYSHDSLGIRGYAEKRDDALRELHEAFDYAYAAFALEQDDLLDEKAQLLKKRLLELVESVKTRGVA